MYKKCLVVLNGPSVVRLKQFIQDHNIKEYDVIAVNRWVNIFRRLNLNLPKYVVVGKNSLRYNANLIRQLRQVTFYGIDKFPSPNYHLLKTGPTIVYGQEINMLGALWWSGLYAIQLALRKEYDEIHVFGFTCTNQPDYADNMQRAPIRTGNLNKIIRFLTQLKTTGVMNRIKFYEDTRTHPFRNLIFTASDGSTESSDIPS